MLVMEELVIRALDGDAMFEFFKNDYTEVANGY